MFVWETMVRFTRKQSRRAIGLSSRCCYQQWHSCGTLIKPCPLLSPFSLYIYCWSFGGKWCYVALSLINHVNVYWMAVDVIRSMNRKGSQRLKWLSLWTACGLLDCDKRQQCVSLFSSYRSRTLLQNQDNRLIFSLSIVILNESLVLHSCKSIDTDRWVTLIRCILYQNNNPDQEHLDH